MSQTSHHFATTATQGFAVEGGQNSYHAVSPSGSNEGVFASLLDTVNPLQQIPGVGQAYRAATHTHISNGSQLAGHVAIGGMIAGPIGAAAGAGVFVLEHLVPGVFRFIGKLFSAGKTANQPAETPQLKLSGGQHGAPAASSSAIVPDHKIVPQLSNAQFESLFSDFGTAPKSPNGKTVPQDLSAVITANLDKYRKLQHIVSQPATATAASY